MTLVALTILYFSLVSAMTWFMLAYTIRRDDRREQGDDLDRYVRHQRRMVGAKQNQT